VIVEYGTARPVAFYPNNRTWYHFSNCHGFDGPSIHFTARALFPNSDWNTTSGSAVNMSIFSAADGCVTPVCKNNLSATGPDMGLCAWTAPSKQTDYFVYIEASDRFIAAQLITINVLMEGLKELPPVPAKKASDQCPPPDKYENLLPFLHSDGVISVVNSPYDSSVWRQFTFPICAGFDKGFTFRAQSTDTKSAFSSYLCNSTSGAPPCTAANSFIWATVGSGLNVIPVTIPITETVYMSVAGWGAKNDQSTLVWSVSAPLP